MDVNQVVQLNCVEGMKLLDDNSVDCCVTSPPYDDLRTYNDSSKWDFEVFEKVAEQLYRVMKVGGTLVWVVGVFGVFGVFGVTGHSLARWR